MFKPEDIVIVSYARTPIGAFQGSLSALSAIDLGKHAVLGALENSKVRPEEVDQVIIGNVLSANLGQAPAKQISNAAKLPASVVCTTINQVCASGMKALIVGASELKEGRAQVVVAGGSESMSNVPFYMPKARSGQRLGHTEILDGLIKDGLWDPYDNVHMGQAGELCAAKYKKTRAEQDEFATLSFKRAAQAALLPVVREKIVSITVPQGRSTVVVSADEQLTKNDPAKLKTLRPAFKKEEDGGTVTAGNASSLNDGAAVVILTTGKKATDSNLNVIARIISVAEVSQDPLDFTTSPSIAIKKALERAGLQKDDVQFYEINEAFAVVALANAELLGLDLEKINVFGGAVALGHPLGCSGARIVTTLLTVLQHHRARYGCASVCNGGGGASAIVIENFLL